VLSDARELASDQQIDADVCIVGAGPAGISIARELIGNGASVWLLESGGRDVERRAQRLNVGQSVGYLDPSAAPVSGSGVRWDEQALVQSRR
jgi:choline dehydrogenase-like flavoprotein